MELKIFRDTLPQGGAGCTVKAELPLETEIRISDDLPPVGKLVKCFVRPVVLQRQLQPGRLTLEGYLRCTVFYQSEAEKGLCQTEQKLPFTRQLELPELAFTAWTAVVEGQTEYLNTRAADPRRIEVRGAYGLVVTVHTQCKTEVITALADGGIEQQLRTLQGVRSVAVLDKLVTLEGELVFAKPPAAVLDITGNACVSEVKLLTGKAVVKGELRVQCAWRAEGDTALQSQAAALPFQQVIDLEGITEDCRCLCVAEPVGFTLSQSESAAAQLTANVMLHLRAWRSYQLQVAVDAFSTRFETELTPQPLVTEQLLCTLNDTATATGSGPLPDAGAQLRACFVHYGPQQAVQKGEGWVLAAKAVVTALAENTLGELESYEKTLEVAVPLPVTPPEGTVLVPECWLSTENVQCTCAGGTLEATITVREEGDFRLHHQPGHRQHHPWRPAARYRPRDRSANLLRAGRGGAVCSGPAVPCSSGADPCGESAGRGACQSAAGTAAADPGHLSCKLNWTPFPDGTSCRAGEGDFLPVPAQKKAAQRITKSRYKMILKIKHIIDVKYNEYTFSIFF